MRMPPAALPLLGLLVLGACAARPPASDPEALAEYRAVNDPAEPFNRRAFAVHTAIDENVLIPVARGYRDYVPRPVRTGVGNVLGNLRSPVILMNDMLQGQPRRAGDTAGRFVVNSTLGLGGIVDVAKDMGVPAHNEDFGQTLAGWGVREGPYLFIPVLGPSNPRDLAGFGVDLAANPLTWLGQGAAVTALSGVRAGATVVDTREGLLDAVDGVNRTSLDPYATFRSAFRQRRAAEIANRGGPAAAPAAGTGVGLGFGAQEPSQPARP